MGGGRGRLGVVLPAQGASFAVGRSTRAGLVRTGSVNCHRGGGVRQVDDPVDGWRRDHRGDTRRRNGGRMVSIRGRQVSRNVQEEESWSRCGLPGVRLVSPPSLLSLQITPPQSVSLSVADSGASVALLMKAAPPFRPSHEWPSRGGKAGLACHVVVPRKSSYAEQRLNHVSAVRLFGSISSLDLVACHESCGSLRDESD